LYRSGEDCTFAGHAGRPPTQAGNLRKKVRSLPRLVLQAGALSLTARSAIDCLLKALESLAFRQLQACLSVGLQFGYATLGAICLSGIVGVLPELRALEKILQRRSEKQTAGYLILERQIIGSPLQRRNIALQRLDSRGKLFVVIATLRACAASNHDTKDRADCAGFHDFFPPELATTHQQNVPNLHLRRGVQTIA
jgi:hypothetical protein